MKTKYEIGRWNPGGGYADGRNLWPFQRPNYPSNESEESYMETRWQP